MSKSIRRKRPQSQKSNKHALSNPEYAAAMRELRRSSATERHHTPVNYRRSDYRAQAQRGVWE